MNLAVPHKFRDPTIYAALVVALACTALQVSGLEAVLRFERDAIATGAWWRLLSGNFVHLGYSHLAMNLAGLALVVALMGAYFKPCAWSVILLASCLATGGGLYAFDQEVHWYVGFSGALHGLLLAGALADLKPHPRSGALLLVLLGAKIAYEQWVGAVPGSADMAGGPVVVNAHLYGAVGGAVAGALLLVSRARRRGVTADRH